MASATATATVMVIVMVIVIGLSRRGGPWVGCFHTNPLRPLYYLARPGPHGPGPPQTLHATIGTRRHTTPRQRHAMAEATHYATFLRRSISRTPFKGDPNRWPTFDQALSPQQRSSERRQRAYGSTSTTHPARGDPQSALNKRYATSKESFKTWQYTKYIIWNKTWGYRWENTSAVINIIAADRATASQPTNHPANR